MEGFEVLFADILITSRGQANWPFPSGQFRMQDVFWNIAIIHAASMAQLAEASLPQETEYGVELCSLSRTVVFVTLSYQLIPSIHLR